MLEMIHRMPLNSEQWKQYVKAVLGTMFKLMEVNEITTRILIEIVYNGQFFAYFRSKTKKIV